jgi:hypothetical protein
MHVDQPLLLMAGQPTFFDGLLMEMAEISKYVQELMQCLLLLCEKQLALHDNLHQHPAVVMAWDMINRANDNRNIFSCNMGNMMGLLIGSVIDWTNGFNMANPLTWTGLLDEPQGRTNDTFVQPAQILTRGNKMTQEPLRGVE